MNTVYLFFENENIRIPLYRNDNALFFRLLNSNMGQWVKADRNYYISRPSYDSKQMKTIVSGRPFVEVGKEPNNPVIVHGFLSDWQSVLDEKEAAIKTETHHMQNDQPEDMPDQFPNCMIDKMEIEMRSLKYSKHTRSAYIGLNRALCRWLQKPPDDVNSDDVKRYLAYLEHTKHQSASTLNTALSAFKFFYNHVLKSNTAQDQRRPRQDQKLPVILSKAEVKKMIDSESNIKHRLVLMMVYASGLRVSEVVKLRRQEIDFKRKKILIIAGKGRKDRNALMSQTVMETLKIYYRQFNITEWLFKGAEPGSHLSIRSAQYICKQAIKKAKIKKAASIHSLRHAFATHLLEGGTDIYHIRDLMGHSSIKTTERYAHVANRKTLKIISPMDTIDDEDED